MKKVKFMGNVLLVTAILTFCFIAVVSFFSAPESNGLFGLKGYVVISGSMEPSISPGDFILTKSGPFEEIEVGDIITFVGDQDIVTHRVEAITSEGLTTKGDANDNPDASSVPEERYIGSHQFTMAYFGLVIIFLQKPLVFILIAVTLAAYFIMGYIKDNKDDVDETEKAS